MSSLLFLYDPKMREKKKRCCYFASNTLFEKSSEMSRVNGLKNVSFSHQKSSNGQKLIMVKITRRDRLRD